MSVEPSRAFDTVAADYDDQPDHYRPASVIGHMVDDLARLLQGKSCLELGAGTGAMTIPLADRGLDITATDSSGPMLEQLAAKHPGLPCIRADATSLGFPDNSFYAVLGFWVLHLIPDWQAAVREAVRVTQPRGLLVIEHLPPVAHELMDVWFTALDWLPAANRLVGLEDLSDLRDFCVGLKLTHIPLPHIESTRSMTVAEMITSVTSPVVGRLRGIPEAALAQLRRDLEVKFAAKLGLQTRFEHTAPVRWAAYRLPS